MRIDLICFSRSGYCVGEKIRKYLDKKLLLSENTWGKQENVPCPEVILYSKSKYTTDTKCQVTETLGQWTGRHFSQADAIIFIGACGIAVRAIAPYVRSKKTDPAVLVIDDQGKYVISLLSGHLGGANELAQMAAAATGAVPVITTATDLHQRFAVDVFAKKNNCYISNMTYAKEISAALLSGETIGFYSDFPWEGQLPEGLVPYEEGETHPPLGIAVTVSYSKRPYEHTLYLVPQIVSLGIGCRKGTPKAQIEEMINAACDEMLVPIQAVERIASIDLKKEEPGLIEYARQQEIPFVTYTMEELQAAEGDFTPSAFVKEITGIDNVCERSAAVSCRQGRLIMKKKAEHGVTVAMAVKKWSVCFE